jgi:hypothetical protein
MLERRRFYSGSHGSAQRQQLSTTDSGNQSLIPQNLRRLKRPPSVPEAIWASKPTKRLCAKKGVFFVAVAGSGGMYELRLDSQKPDSSSGGIVGVGVIVGVMTGVAVGTGVRVRVTSGWQWVSR